MNSMQFKITRHLQNKTNQIEAALIPISRPKKCSSRTASHKRTLCSCIIGDGFMSMHRHTVSVQIKG